MIEIEKSQDFDMDFGENPKIDNQHFEEIHIVDVWDLDFNDPNPQFIED